MAFKIYKKNNYLIIEDTLINKQYQGLAKNVFVYKDEKLENVYDFDILDDHGLKGVPLSEMIDSTDTPFTPSSFLEFYTKETGSIGSGDATAANQVIGNTILTSIDSKIPPLGQALISTSLPTVLPQSQINALTPPPAITGFNLESTQLQVKANQVLEIAELAAINTKLTADKIVQDNILVTLEDIRLLLKPIVGTPKISSHTSSTLINVNNCYKVSITMIDSGTIEGVSVPAGFTWNLENLLASNIQVNGTNFIITKLEI